MGPWKSKRKALGLTLDEAKEKLSAAQAEGASAKAGWAAAKAAYAQERDAIDAKERGLLGMKKAHAKAALPWSAPAAKAKES